MLTRKATGLSTGASTCREIEWIPSYVLQIPFKSCSFCKCAWVKKCRIRGVLGIPYQNRKAALIKCGGWWDLVEMEMESRPNKADLGGDRGDSREIFI